MVNFAQGSTSFACHQVTESKLSKGSKMNWPQLYCVHLFELCRRVNVNLKFSHSADEYSFKLENYDGCTVILAFAKSFSVYFEEYLV